MFKVNQIVKGIVAGEFIILGFRTIGGEDFAQLKPYDIKSAKTGRGELALPLSKIIAA